MTTRRGEQVNRIQNIISMQLWTDLHVGCFIHSGSKPSTTIKHHFHPRSSQIQQDSTDQLQLPSNSNSKLKSTNNTHQSKQIKGQYHNWNQNRNLHSKIRSIQRENNKTQPSFEQRRLGEMRNVNRKAVKDCIFASVETVLHNSDETMNREIPKLIPQVCV